MEGDIVVIGLGHPDRADDGVGPVLAGELEAYALARVRVESGSLDAAAMLDAWSGAAGAILLDCVRSGRPVGTVHCLDPFDGSVDGVSFGSSTHVLGIGTAVELARALGELPSRLALVGVEGRRFSMGGAMSREVQDAIPAAVRAAKELIARWRRESTPEEERRA
jgi:hydrogenase maturation protease